MLHRRELLAALLGTPAALLAGCSKPASPVAGELLAPNLDVGHRIRDGYRPTADAGSTESTDVIIVGGGVAGLSAAWRLRQEGIKDFVVLELESSLGGTAKCQVNGSISYPWGAHYVPSPMAENVALIRLFQEMGVVQSVAADGTPQVAEQYLCRDPQERVFHQGHWRDGLYPVEGASEDDLQQLSEFRAEIARWVGQRDGQGRRMFAIPMATGSDAPEVMSLDRESMAGWMDRHGWTSPRLRWLADYSCRDDYGLSIDQASAWAGMFYFASRLRDPDSDSQPVITWPEGNGAIVNHLASCCESQIRSGHAVTQIKVDRTGSSANVVCLDTTNDRTASFRAKRIIFAAPQFMAPRLLDGFADRGLESARFQYGSWLVANLHLSDRPTENGFPMCWDNVIYGSKSLGYVTSTHQTGNDHGPTVLTWYYPLTAADPKIPRQQLLAMSWSDWADVVLADMEVPHPDIRSLVTRLDVMRWGHAMIQPRLGFVSDPARRKAAAPFGPVHFAGTDLSGIALFEEAFYHGVRAAEEVVRIDRPQTSSIL